jgi:hypothetical protein
MRAVLDTNVLVRATKNATGPAREVLRYFESQGHVLVLSHAILTELIRVLHYPRVRAFHRLTTRECVQFAQALHDAAEVVPIPARSTADAISTDPDDDPVIHTAVRGNAEVICTLDRHLRTQAVRDYCNQHGIDVLTDTEFLAILRAAESQDED